MEAAKLVFRKGFLFSRFFTIASKFTGPIGLAIAMYQVIELCESYSQQKRRRNNIVWDQTCKFGEVINALISTEVRYHEFIAPKLDITTIEGKASNYGDADPLDWKTYFNRIVKTGSANPDPSVDCERFLMQFDRETKRSKMYETRGISFFAALKIP